MKSLLLRLILFAVLLLTALTTEAQYRKLRKGEPMPYDTGVAVEIGRYRIEGHYIKRSRILIDSLNVEAKALTLEVDSLNAELTVTNSLYNNEVEKSKTLSESYLKLSQDSHQLSQLFDRIANKPEPFLYRLLKWEGNWLAKTGKVIVGVIVITLAGHGAVQAFSN